MTHSHQWLTGQGKAAICANCNLTFVDYTKHFAARSRR